MAKKIVIDLEAKTDKAIKGIEGIAEGVKKLNKDVISSNKKTEQSLDGVEKASKSVAKGIKGIGTGLKAIGIGLIISALGTLKDLFSQNQKIVDVFNTTFEVAAQMVSQVTTAFTDIYDALTQTTDQFDALGKVVKGAITIAFTPLKLTFYGIKLAVEQAMLAWEKSFFGDKDPETIKNLNLSITETRTNLLDVGKAALNAGKDIVDNFVEAVSEVGEAGKVVVKELGEVSVSAAVVAAKTNVELQKSAELAAARQGLIFEKFDRQAEKLRQIRDDETKTIKERKGANDQLLISINEAEAAMLLQAQQQLTLANANLAKDKENIEFKTAQIEAERELAAVEAQIEGIRSEQKSNALALDREERDLEKENEEIRLEQLQERADREIEIEQSIADRKKQINLDYINFAAGLSGLLQQIAGKNKALALAGLILEKGSAIANVVVKAKEAILTSKANEAKIPYLIPTPFGAPIPNPLKPASLAATTKQILGTKLSAGLAIAGITATALGQGKSVGSGGTTPSGGAIPAAAPPAFNVVGASDTNQLAAAIGGQSQQPVQAYVVSNDVTTAQSMDRNIVDDAGLGG